MFISFFHQLKKTGVPVSIREYLDFVSGLSKGVTQLDTNCFYYFARSSLVKDERHFDRFDKVFSEFFEGALNAGEKILAEIPDHWIMNALQKNLSEAEKQQIKSLGV